MENESSNINMEDKIIVTKKFKAMIKPKDYQQKKDHLKVVTVEYLTENFEEEEVDHEKVIPINETDYVFEKNNDINSSLEKLKSLFKHSEIMTRMGDKIHNCNLKSKLLKQLEKSGKNFGQSSSNFDKKFENLLKKDNSVFVQKAIEKTKNLEYSIGLDLAGTISEALLVPDVIDVELIKKMELGPELEVDKEYERIHILTNKLFMFARDERDAEDYGVSELYFYELNFDYENKKTDYKELTLENKYASRDYIYNTHYFEEEEILVLFTRPAVDDITIIKIYSLSIEEKSVRMEPLHRIETKSEHATVARHNGIYYLVYSYDEFEKDKDFYLILANLSDTLETPSVKPFENKIKSEVLFYKPFILNNHLLLFEGERDELALFDFEKMMFVAYYKDNKKKDYFNYFSASYSKSKGLLLLLHNDQNGAVITSFNVDFSNQKLNFLQDVSIGDDLKNASVNPYVNQYFTMQFNLKTNRLVLVDDDYQQLFKFKINNEKKLEKDGVPQKLNLFELRDSSCWGHFIRADDKSIFIHVFPYENVFRTYVTSNSTI